MCVCGSLVLCGHRRKAIARREVSLNLASPREIEKTLKKHTRVRQNTKEESNEKKKISANGEKNGTCSSRNRDGMRRISKLKERRTKSESKKIYLMKLCGSTKEALRAFSHTPARNVRVNVRFFGLVFLFRARSIYLRTGISAVKQRKS